MGSWNAPPQTPGPFGFSVSGAGQQATLLSRVVAWILDWVILAIISSVVTAVLGLLHLAPAGWILSIAVSLAYWTYFWGSTGQTLGYRVMRIRAVTLSGEPLGYGLAFLRGLLVNLSFAFCIVPAVVSLIMMAATPKHQAIHDLLLGTVVVGA